MRENILVIHPNWLGDVIFSTPFIRNLAGCYPDADIVSCVVPRCRELLEVNPNIKEVIEFDEKDKQSSLLAKFQFVKTIQAKNISRVFILRPSLTRTFLTTLAGIRKRTGHKSLKSQLLLTNSVKADETEMHRADYYLALLRPFNYRVDEKGCDFFYTENDTKNAQMLLSGLSLSDKGFCVLNPGGNWGNKRWPLECYVELAKKVREELGFSVLITGAPKDVSLAEEIASSCGDGVFPVAGKTTLREVGALFDMSAFVVSADSGPLHIASALGVKTVALFGPTRPELTGPYRCDGEKLRILQTQLDCNETACYKDGCAHIECMRSITSDDVLTEIKTLLN